MAVQPYLFFDGRTEEALAFYRKTLDAEIGMVMRFKDNPDPMPPGYTVPPEAVMHSEMTVNGTVIMASDGMHCGGKPSFGGFSLTFEAKDPAEAKRRFDALSAEGQVQMPFGETFVAEAFGVVNDKFGVSWMVMAGSKNS